MKAPPFWVWVRETFGDSLLGGSYSHVGEPIHVTLREGHQRDDWPTSWEGKPFKIHYLTPPEGF